MPTPEVVCVVCDQDALVPRSVLFCESCEHVHHIGCGRALWVVRDGMDYAHSLCNNCHGLDEEDVQ